MAASSGNIRLACRVGSDEEARFQVWRTAKCPIAGHQSRMTTDIARGATGKENRRMASEQAASKNSAPRRSSSRKRRIAVT